MNKSVIQSCDRPSILYVGVNKQRQFQLLPRERKKFLNIPEEKQMLLPSRKIKEYKIKGLIHALPEKMAQNISWYLKFLGSAQKFHSNSVRPSTKITYSTGQKRWFFGRRVNRHGPIDANDLKGMGDPERSIQTINANMARVMHVSISCVM